MSVQTAWWPLRKAYRLFFDDWRLSLPVVIWLACSLAFPRLGLGAAWRAILLFVGFAAILLGASLVAAWDARTRRDPTPAAGRPSPIARSRQSR